MSQVGAGIAQENDAMPTKNTPTSTKPTSKPANAVAPVVETAPKPTGNYAFGYNAKTKEYQIKGSLAEMLDRTSTGKPVYVRIPGRLVEFKTSDGRTLRFSVYVDEITDEKPVQAASGAPAGVDAKTWAAFEQFQAFQASLKK